MFDGPFSESIVKRAQDKRLLEIALVDIRDFGIGRHKAVDDKPYGGGVGMVLRFDVLAKAIQSTLDDKLNASEQKVVLLSASGELFEQKIAKDLSNLKHLILICGHYEGVDERILKYVDAEISIGNFVLTGGEIPAMMIADSVVRLIPGVITDGATETESFSNISLEHPQYTRPDIFEGEKVPGVLLSGNHSEIAKWKEEESVKKTKKNRKDIEI